MSITKATREWETVLTLSIGSLDFMLEIDTAWVARMRQRWANRKK